MKRRGRFRVSALVLAVLIVILLSSDCFAEEGSAMRENENAVPDTVCFNSEGKLKIMVISDFQDGLYPVSTTLKLVNAALDAEKPDLVVLGGDNIFGYAPTLHFSRANCLKAIEKMAAPVVERGIPFCVIMGNHDADAPLSTYEQMQKFMSFPTCLARIGEAASGVGNYEISVVDKDGKAVFGLWFLDSGNLAPKEEGGGYAYVTDEQIAWYEMRSAELQEQNGGSPLPSLLFQHIPVPEIYNVLKVVPKGSPGAFKGYRSHSSNYYAADETALISGVYREGPCPPDINNGQFESWVKMGNIMAAFFGHDHVNDAAASWRGIDLVYNGSVGFSSYCSGYDNGVRIIELDEAKPGSYSTRMVYYKDLLDEKLPFQQLHFGELAFRVSLAGCALLLLILGLAVRGFVLIRRLLR